MSISVTSGPSGMPVSLDEAKRQCAITGTTHDTLLTGFIASATAAAESYLGSLLMRQTVEVGLDGFAAGRTDLGVYPAHEISSIKYDDDSGAEQTLGANDYWESLGGMYPSIYPVDVWPATKTGKPGSVRVTMTVGYSDADSVPDDIRHAILVRVKEMYANRGETVIGTSIEKTTLTMEALLSLHRRVSL